MGVLKPIFYADTQLAHTYFAQSLELISNVYLASVFELVALSCQILSVYKCLQLISFKKKADSKYFHLFLIALILLLSLGLFSFQLINYKIVKSDNLIEDNKKEKVVYILVETKFYNSVAKSIWEVCSFVIRDLICLVVLVTLNVSLYLKVRQNVKHKIFAINFVKPKVLVNSVIKNMSSSLDTRLHVTRLNSPEQNKINKRHSSEIHSQSSVKQIERFENKIAVMVILNSIIYVLGTVY